MKSPEMQNLPRIKFDEKDAEYFSKYFRENFKGKLPKGPYEELVVEMSTKNKENKFEIHVDMKQMNKIFLEVYHGGKLFGKVDVDNSGRLVVWPNGKKIANEAEFKPSKEVKNLPEPLQAMIIKKAFDIFANAYLFFVLERNSCNMYEAHPKKMKNGKGKKSTGKKNTNGRIQVIVPRPKRISCAESTEKKSEDSVSMPSNVQATPISSNTRTTNPKKRQAKYTKDEWQVSGFKRVVRGKEQHVKGYTCKRNPKLIAKEGIDLILKPKK